MKILSPPYRGADLVVEEEMENWDTRSIQPVGEIFAHPLLFLVVFLFLFLPPAVKILRRTGHNPLWCVFAIFPVLNLGALWLFAFKSWPTDKESAS